MAWKGTLAIGSLIAPHIKLEKFVATPKSLFHEYHAADNGEMGRKPYCKACGMEATDVVKGYTYEKKKVITLTQQELDCLPLASNRGVVVESFVASNEVSPTLFTETYAVTPEAPTDAKVIGLLTEALLVGGKVAVGKVVLTNREHLCAVYPKGNHLMLSTMAWIENVRNPEVLKHTPAAQQELGLMTQFIEAMTKPFNHADYSDKYLDAVKVLVANKLAGQVIIAQPTVETPSISLEDALKLSIEAVQKNAS